MNEDRDRSSGGPKKPPTDSLSKPLAKRFYEQVAVGDEPSFHIKLDGRVVKTPSKRTLLVPVRPLAEAIAEEWAAQNAVIDPRTMPLTRFANSALDTVEGALDAVAAEIAAYAASDLVCYRADGPKELIALQAQHWDGVVAWAADALGAKFIVTKGVMPVRQPDSAIAAVAAALAPYEPFGLAGLHVLTTLTGSALLALAFAHRRLSAGETWTAAHVDEDYQIAMWGEDYEAAERRKARLAEFNAACRLLELLRTYR